MSNRTNKIIGITLHVTAGILLAYTIWAIINCSIYIGDMMGSGQLTFAGNEYDIVSFYMSNCMQYLIFSVLLFVMGFLVIQNIKVELGTEETLELKSQNDDDIDEWLEVMESLNKNSTRK